MTHEISIFVKTLFNFKKKILAWIKANLKTFNIAKNEELELITSCHFKNLISPKTAWNSQWSLISSRNLKWQHHCTYFSHRLLQIVFLKKDFSGNPVNLDMGIYFNYSSWTFKVELQLWWYKNLFSSSFKRDCPQITFATLNGFCLLSKNNPRPVPKGQYQDG